MSKLIKSYLFKTSSSTFRAAIQTNNTNRICRILDTERGYICKDLDSAGNTALLLAIRYATPLTVGLLLEQGAHPDQANFQTSQTPLSLLASKIYENHQSREAKLALEMATIILDHGAFVDNPSPYLFTDEEGRDYIIKETPLMTAVRTKNLPMAALFVERKANVNYVEKHSGNRPIHFTIANGDSAMFDLLENAGALCRSTVSFGNNTLLHWFCHNNTNDQHVVLLNKIVNKGCDVNAQNGDRRTPLMLAAQLDMINTCHILLNAGADIDIVEENNHRAIDFAAPDSECFKILQEATHLQKMKSLPPHPRDRVPRTRQNDIKRPLSLRMSEPERLNADENILKRYVSTSNCHEDEINKTQNYSSNLQLDQNEDKTQNYLSNLQLDRKQGMVEISTKHTRMWDKLLHRKQKARHPDFSLHKSKDSVHYKSTDSFQQRFKERPSQRKRDTSQHERL